MRLILLGLFLSVLLTLTVAPLSATEPADLIYATPGRLVDVGGFRLNIRCFGSGSPTVVFDAGLSDWSPVWATVQPSIARRTRTCSYDRAGYGFSDAGPLPRTSARIVSELHILLHRAGERPPFVLVGHSFGSFNMRLFADRYLEEVVGIVLVDGSHEDQQPLFDRSETERYARDLSRCQRAAKAGFRGAAVARSKCVDLGLTVPDKQYSPQLIAALERQTPLPKQYEATLSELRNFGAASSDEVRAAKRAYGSIPLRILTATNHRDPDSKKSDAYWRHLEAGWHALQITWLPLSTDSKEIIVRGSGHYIQFDRTSIVVESIYDVIKIARSRPPFCRTWSCIRVFSRFVELVIKQSKTSDLLFCRTPDANTLERARRNVTRASSRARLFPHSGHCRSNNLHENASKSSSQESTRRTLPLRL